MQQTCPLGQRPRGSTIGPLHPGDDLRQESDRKLMKVKTEFLPILIFNTIEWQKISRQ